MAEARSISGDPVGRRPSGRRPEAAVLPGALVDLERLDPRRHADELFAASHESEAARRIWTYLPDGPFDGPGSFTGWLADFAAMEERAAYAFRDRETGRAAGMATYLNIEAGNGSLEIGYIWFAPALQRTRQATEALFVMLRHAFDDLAYRRVEWKCNALNEASRRAALRLGFTYEGVFYQHMVVKGCNRDSAWYSLLDHEWPRVRANFLCWLAADNFDAEGRQRRSLRQLNAPA